jgi:hypothetical protein
MIISGLLRVRAERFASRGPFLISLTGLRQPAMVKGTIFALRPQLRPPQMAM